MRDNRTGESWVQMRSKVMYATNITRFYIGRSIAATKKTVPLGTVTKRIGDECRKAGITGFTLIPCTGFYQGVGEKSVILEIIGTIPDDTVKKLTHNLCASLSQKSIYVTRGSSMAALTWLQR